MYQMEVISLGKLLGLPKREAALEVLTMFYEAAGFENETLSAELSHMNDESLYSTLAQL